MCKSITRAHSAFFFYFFVPKEYYASTSISNLSFIGCFMFFFSFPLVCIVSFSTVWNLYIEIPESISKAIHSSSLNFKKVQTQFSQQ